MLFKILHQLAIETTRLILALPVSRCAGHDTDLPLNSNISKTVRGNIAFRKKPF